MADILGHWPGELTPTGDHAEVRRIFNEMRYFERYLAGDLSIDIRDDRHPEPSPRGHQSCTRSRYVYFVEGGVYLASAHMYLLPDGSLGGSGRPDPRVVVTEDGRASQWDPRRNQP